MSEHQQRIQAAMEQFNADGASSRESHLLALQLLDHAVCEALAVGQTQAGRQAPSACIGYATYLFARLCSHGTSLIRAAPLSRWMYSDHQYWDFSSVACHARALLEGNLYFHYFMAPENEELEEGRARITLMQLNDCCSRLKIFETIPEQRQWFEEQAEQLRNRLRSIPFFQQLATPTQNSCLAGRKAWFLDRQQLVEAVGWEKAAFDVLWDLWSQHSHIHPVSFLRMEPNARGSGLECDPDRLYIAKAMLFSASILSAATDKIVEVFPDVADQRRGVDSKFSPGPASNAPVH